MYWSLLEFLEIRETVATWPVSPLRRLRDAGATLLNQAVLLRDGLRASSQLLRLGRSVFGLKAP